MQNLGLPEPITLPLTTMSCISDMDYFIKTLTSMQDQELGPDLIGSIITHYSSKWLPRLSADGHEKARSTESSPESFTASWMRKKIFIEALVAILPQDKDSIPCNVLLRLLRIGNMVRAEPAYLAELEKRVSWQLDRASLKELMIPSFSHTCTTLLDIELVTRLVREFVSMEEAARSGAALMKVAKLVDCYLAEAAVDTHLTFSEFAALATAVPGHARAVDDGLYRAIDTYLKAHPGLSKQERKALCNLIDSRKLSQEASFHAAQNERLTVRAVIQVLLSEQNKLNKHVIDWSGSFTGSRSPLSATVGLEIPGRCCSKREMNFQQIEIKRLKEDVLMLQSQCMAMERWIGKLSEKKKRYGFSWKKFGIPGFKANKVGEIEEAEALIGLKTPSEVRVRPVKGRTPSRRKSMSSSLIG